jgi:hypothetical protein
MDMDCLANRQLAQEEEYIFPYHYNDLQPNDFGNIEYLSVHRTIKGMISPFNGQRVLDVGCGMWDVAMVDFVNELRNEMFKYLVWIILKERLLLQEHSIFRRYLRLLIYVKGK